MPTTDRLLIVGSRVFMPVSGILAGVLLARGLGAEGRGAISSAIVYAEVAPAIFASGLGAASRSLVARGRLSVDLATHAARVASRPAVWFVAPIALAVFAVLGPIRPTSTSGLAAMVLFATTWLTAHRIIIEGTTAADGAYRLQAVVAFSLNLAPLTVIGGLAVLDRLSVSSALLAYSLGYTLSAAIAWRSVTQREESASESGKVRAAIDEMQAEWRRSAPSQILDLLNRRLDLLLLVIVGSTTQVGVFAVAASAARLPTLAAQVSTITAATARRHAQIDGEQANAQLGRLAVFLVIATTFIASASWILIPVVYGEAFESAVELVVPLLVGTCALTLAQVASALLLIEGRSSIVTVAQGLGVAVTLLAVPLGMRWSGLAGAAIGSTAGYLATAAIVFIGRSRTR